MYALEHFPYNVPVKRLNAVVGGVVALGFVIIAAGLLGVAWRVFTYAAGV